MSSESIGSLISQFLTNVNVDDNKSKQISVKIANSIENKSFKLLDIIKALGDYLTADDDLLRPKALLCLAFTLQELKPSSLTSSDIQVLNSFFTSKLDDIKCFKETLIGLTSLIEKDNYHPSLVKSILISFDENYDPKSFVASTRFFAFNLFNKLFDKFSKFILKNFNDLFIKNFINIATGEKDPRNLLLSFELNSKISKTLVINEFTDDLFDVLFCYFPISFKPPKDDPYKITSDDLKNSLRIAIASTNLFANDSYPNLLEKISSTSPVVKKDTLQTIYSCVENYGFDSILENYVELWNGLKFEILHGDQDDDEDKIFPLVLLIFKEISFQLSKNEEKFDEFWNLINAELNSNIENNTKIKQTCLIYSSIASSSNLAFNKVAKLTLSLLFKNSNTLDIQSQRNLISSIGFFTNSYLDVFGSIDNKKSNDVLNNSFLEFKDEILMFLGKSLVSSSNNEISLRTLSINELTKLTTLVEFLNNEELSLIVQYFTETVLTDDNEYVFNSAIGGLIQISKINNQILLEITFPTLLSLLPLNENDEIKFNEEVKTKEKIFDIISSITPNKEISDFLIIRFVNKFIEIGSIEGNNSNYLYLISLNLKKTLESVQNDKQFNTDHYLLKTFGQLSDFIISSVLSNKLTNNNVLDEITDVIKLFIIFSSKKYHQELFDETLLIFENKKIENYKFYLNYQNFDIFNQFNKLINLFVKILSSVDNSIIIENFEEFLLKVIKFIQTNEIHDNYTKIGYLELISLLINKWGSNEIIENSLNLNLNTNSNIEIFTWITKGVILKIDPKSELFINRLIELLNDESINTELTTKSFEILVIDLSIFKKFKKISNNKVRLLYKQKLFQIISPKLVENFKNSSDLLIKSRFLISLSFILKHTQKEIISPYLSTFLPLLLQSLDLKDSNVRYASLLTLLSSIEEIPELISKHLQTLIPRLLELIKFDSKDDDLKFNNPEVRLISLNCLQALTIYISLIKLIPYQKEILSKTVQVLDDKKRKVRKGAVDTREAYYELGRSE